MNKIEINVPQGFQIDVEKSDLSKGLIEFKPIEEKKLTYEDVASQLITGKNAFFLGSDGIVHSYSPSIYYAEGNKSWAYNRKMRI